MTARRPGARPARLAALLPALVVLVAAGGTASARESLLRCHFNEPSLVTEYRPARRVLVMIDPVTGYPEVRRTFWRDVRRRDRAGGRIELSRGDVVLARLTANGRGSDGMSDRLYALSVEAPPGFPAIGYDGGCDWVRGR